MALERRRGPDRRSGMDRRENSGSYERRASLPLMMRGFEPAISFAGESGLPLTRDDFGRWGLLLADLVAGFYNACLDAREWPGILSRLRDTVRADAAALVVHDFTARNGFIYQAVNIGPEFCSSYGSVYAAENPWFASLAQLPAPGEVLGGQDMADYSALIETPFYQQWLAPQRLYHMLFGALDVQSDRAQLLVFARALEKGAFWQDDVALLNRLLPNLRQGFRAAEALRMAEERARAQATALDVLPIGVAMLSADGVVIFANGMAREIFATESLFQIGSNGLGVRLPTGRMRFRDLLVSGNAMPSADGEIYSLSLAREGHHRPLTLIAMTLAPRNRGSSPEEPAALLFIGDPERPTDIDPRRLTRLYGLSRAEARVAVLLAKGLRLEQVAEALDLTYETVRKHVKQIFGKTSTDRQAELVRTLTLGPAGLRL
jgi:DNA-binding CsgD family transcriptional regulator/PAS domain-containing protein